MVPWFWVLKPGDANRLVRTCKLFNPFFSWGSSASRKLPANHETAVIGRWLWQMARPIGSAISQNLLTRQLIWSLSQVLHNKAAFPAFLGIATLGSAAQHSKQDAWQLLGPDEAILLLNHYLKGSPPPHPMQHLLSICFCVEANALYFALSYLLDQLFSAMESHRYKAASYSRTASSQSDLNVSWMGSSADCPHF